MFIRLSEKVVNQNSIIMFSDDNLTLSTSDTIRITKEDYNILEKKLLPKKRESKKDEPKGYMTDLFHKLNKIIGGSDRVVFSKKLQGHLNARMKEGFTEELLVAAAEGMSKNDFYMGNNDRGWQATMEYFLRDSDHINCFLDTNAKKTSRMFND